VEAHENELEVYFQFTRNGVEQLIGALSHQGCHGMSLRDLRGMNWRRWRSRPGVEEAREVDEREYQIARARYEKEFAQWKKMHSLARRVLAGEGRAYTEAVSESSALTEISNLGSSIHMTVHDARVIECELKVNGRDVIPTDMKSLTSTGKLVVKSMPKARFHEIYQDYVCGCVLRLAREMFALLPVDTAILTATVDGIDSRNRPHAELPVRLWLLLAQRLSALLSNILTLQMPWKISNAAVDVMTSRKIGRVYPIVPLSPADIAPPTP